MGVHATFPAVEHKCCTDYRPDSTNQLLRSFGRHPLAYHSLQPGLSLFEIDNCGYIAYQRCGGKAYVPGDPICHPDHSAVLLDRFLASHPEAVFIQVSAGTARHLRKRDFHVSRFGIETDLTLPYALGGGPRADIRHLYNRAQAAGISVRELSLPERQSDQARTLLYGPTGSRRRFEKPFRFLARSGLPLDDDCIRVFGGFADGRLVGLSVFDPMWWQEQVVGYAEVIPRRAIEVPKGTRTCILIEAMAQFASEGIERVSLGLSPLAAEYDTADDLVNARFTEWLMQQVYRFGSRIFNFKGLAFHKSRFRGEERTVYLAGTSRAAIQDLWRIYYLVTGKVLPPLLRR